MGPDMDLDTDLGMETGQDTGTDPGTEADPGIHARVHPGHLLVTHPACHIFETGDG